MSVARYIVLQQQIPGFDSSVEGKALGRAGEALDALAKELGVPALIDFYSADQAELAEFAGEHGLDLGEEPAALPAERWFPAEDGLKTVLALIQAAEEGRIDQAERVLADLQEFRRVLKTAKDHGIRWHLAIDF